jgi:hypothetical protein
VLEGRYGPRWRAIGTDTTDGGGVYQLAVRPRGTRVLRARYGGGGEVRGARSPEAVLRVRATVSLRRPPALGVRGRRVMVRGSVTPRKRRVTQVLQQLRRGRWRTVGTRRVRVTRGRFSSSFVPEGTGRYRVWVFAPGDASTVTSSSRVFTLRVAGPPSRRGGAVAARRR